MDLASWACSRTAEEFRKTEKMKPKWTKLCQLTAELTSAGRVLRPFPTGHLWKVQLSSSLMRGIGADAEGRRRVPLNE